MEKTRSQFAVRWTTGEQAYPVFEGYYKAEEWADSHVEDIKERTGVELEYVIVSRLVTTSYTEWKKHV